jgi:DNA-directed RNA polymerase subunit RPC12/RpoP
MQSTKKSTPEKFYTLGAFEYPADVQVIKGRLEAEGIYVFLRDENFLNTDPLVSQAIGGVKLQVYTRDKDKAIEIYDEYRRYAQDDEGNPIVCPNCKAERSEVYYLRKGFLNKLFPFFEKKKYRCLSCGMITQPR